LGFEVGAEFFGGAEGAGVNVADDGDERVGEGAGVHGGVPFLLDGVHEGGMGGDADGEGEGAFGAGGFGAFDGAFEGGFVPRDDDLSGTVVVGNLDDFAGDACLGADLVEGGDVYAEDCRHAAGVEFAGAFHEFAAGADEFESVGEGEGAGGGEGGEFAEGVPGKGGWFDVGV